MKEISIEDKTITHSTIHIEFFEENREESITRPLNIFENWVIDNELLNWHQHKKRMDGDYDEIYGTITFDQFIDENVTDEILEKFVRHELEK